MASHLSAPQKRSPHSGLLAKPAPLVRFQGYTPDLFDEAPCSPAPYRQALAGWLAEAGRAGRIRRVGSAAVYEHIWSALSTWAVAQGIALDDFTASDLDSYLRSRAHADELSPRYAWRTVWLVGRLLGFHARAQGRAANPAALEFLERRPDIRFANAAHRDGLPAFLDAATARRLVALLSAVRPGRGAAGQAWQEVRNRACVGLMLGAGLTPGEARALKLEDVVSEGGRRAGTPWKLRVCRSASAPARETPLAPWAGQLLRHWLDVRRQQGLPGDWLFPSTKSTGRQWGKVSQYTATLEVLAAAGVDAEGGGSFKLRHTFALRQLRRGTPAADVERWLGVSDPAVMARYRRVVMAPEAVV